MSSSKKTQDTLDNILAKVIEMSTKFHNLQITVDKQTEISNLINARVSDLNTKKDLEMSLTTVSSSKASSKGSKAGPSTDGDKKKTQNIMEFFKEKFSTDQEILLDIVSQSELDELYLKHADDIKSKSKKPETLEKFKASLVYKTFIKDDENKKKKLRNLKDKEESNNIVIKSEMTENVIEDIESVNENEPEDDEPDHEPESDDHASDSD